MTAKVAYDDVAVGDALPGRPFTVLRADLVAYAGASGDLNPIHWSDRAARAAGLPDVIAHGMLTMARAVIVVTDWVGDPTCIREYGVRFVDPVVVPDGPMGAVVTASAVVAEKRADRCVVVELSAAVGGGAVLGRSTAVVALA